MTRRCSHCSNNGHNSRTCPTRGGGVYGGGGGGGAAAVKLFGVRLTDGSIIKKSASMGNLSALAAAAAAAHHHSPSSSTASPNHDSPLSDHVRDQTQPSDGYLSDGPAHGSGSAHGRGDRKKGVPWTEEEHRLFLIGLQKLGKGDWRGISRNYVISRTPTQVASHAQKYFIRQSNSTRRKRRSSLFDMVTDDMVTDTSPIQEDQASLLSSPPKEPENTSSQPSLDLSLKTAECEPALAVPQESTKEPEDAIKMSSAFSPMVVPGFFPSYFPVTYTFWPSAASTSPLGGHITEASQHQVLKPIPGVAKEPVNVDELVGMSNLSIAGAQRSHREPSPLSLKLIGEPSRPSAFHSNRSVSGSDLSKGNSAIQAV